MQSEATTRPSTTQRVTCAVTGAVIGGAILLAQSAGAQPAGAPESFADLAESVSPAVVNITTTTTVEAPSRDMPRVPEGSPFEEFFRDFFGGPDGDNGRPESRRGEALGSGFVISGDGYIVTNNHVIEQADEILIEFFEGEELPAEVIGTDDQTDIALLKVEADVELPYVSFGDADASRVGDWVVAMGNPLGQGFSVSAGIISASGRVLQGGYDDFIQTDAAINRGNSGGPLFNMDGEVIGVNTAILSPTGGSVGIGFAMSSNVVSGVVDQLREFGETRRGWLGVQIQNVTEDMAEALGLDDAAGAMVTDVPEGPARSAGVRAGDVILSFDGEDIADTNTLVRRVGDAEVGREVEVEVYRDDERVTLAVELGRREHATGSAVEEPAEPEAPESREEDEVIGLNVATLSEEMREELGLPDDVQGLVVEDVAPGSDAEDKGVMPGDIITQASQHAVTTPADLAERVEAAREAGRDSILLLIRRGGEPRFVAVSINED